MAILHARGTILFVSQVPDQNGVNHKDRHVVLLNDLDSADTVFHGVAVTGTFMLPLPVTSVSLPWHRQGRCQTGLDKKSVADCTWIVTATPADIKLRRGMTPASNLVSILQHAQVPQPPAPPAASSPPPPTTSGS